MVLSANIFLLLSLLGLILFDAVQYRLPNWITLPLLVAGLLYVAQIDGSSALALHTLTAITVFLVFWFVSIIYERRNNQTGLGMGDAKLVAAMGAWLGPFLIAPAIALASLGGLLFLLIRRFGGGELALRTRLPFGPFLSLGFIVVWLSRDLLSGYLVP